MGEGHVTVEGHTYRLRAPFMVVATQNPVEHHGTYPLPESQLDRFLLRLRIGYPDRQSERDILRNGIAASSEAVQGLLSPEDVLQLQGAVHAVDVDNALVDYL